MGVKEDALELIKDLKQMQDSYDDDFDKELRALEAETKAIKKELERVIKQEEAYKKQIETLKSEAKQIKPLQKQIEKLTNNENKLKDKITSLEANLQDAKSYDADMYAMEKEYERQQKEEARLQKKEEQEALKKQKAEEKEKIKKQKAEQKELLARESLTDSILQMDKAVSDINKKFSIFGSYLLAKDILKFSINKTDEYMQIRNEASKAGISYESAKGLNAVERSLGLKQGGLVADMAKVAQLHAEFGYNPQAMPPELALLYSKHLKMDLKDFPKYRPQEWMGETFKNVDRVIKTGNHREITEMIGLLNKAGLTGISDVARQSLTQGVGFLETINHYQYVSDPSKTLIQTSSEMQRNWSEIVLRFENALSKVIDGFNKLAGIPFFKTLNDSLLFSNTKEEAKLARDRAVSTSGILSNKWLDIADKREALSEAYNMTSIRHAEYMLQKWQTDFDSALEAKDIETMKSIYNNIRMSKGLELDFDDEMLRKKIQEQMGERLLQYDNRPLPSKDMFNMQTGINQSENWLRGFEGATPPINININNENGIKTSVDGLDNNNMVSVNQGGF